MRGKMMTEREVIQHRLEHLETRLRTVMAARARTRARIRAAGNRV